jgi:hypothetical protein
MRMSNYTHDYNRFLARLLRWLDIATDLQGYISEMLPKGLAGAPISSEKFWAYSSSNSDQGMRLAMITQRLSGDNFPSKGKAKFSGGVGGSSTLRYISTS